MARIKKCVITAAGRGTRLLPFTKEMPKEMLPIYSSQNNKMVLKPILQVIYESIYDFGISDICFVVGRGKRSIEDHFLIDNLSNDGNSEARLDRFFEKLKHSNLTYVQQPFPSGFGDAVLKAKNFIGNENFLLHAGDDIILSLNNNHLKRLEKSFYKFDAEMAFLVSSIEDPRAYGVIEGEKIQKGVIKVKNLEEKPKKPKSNLAVIATYLFTPHIFKILSRIKPDKNDEIQLADAVQEIIHKGKTIAVELTDGEKRIDVGTPESYIECLNKSFHFFNK